MLPQRLRQARKSKKFTQEYLALKVNTKKTTISNYETGYSSPSNEMLRDLADVLGVSTDYLLGRSNDPQPNKKSDVAVAEGDNKFIRKAAEFAEQEGLKLDDPKFLELFEAALDIVKRATQDKQR